MTTNDRGPGLTSRASGLTLHQPAHRSILGGFNATLVTSATMALYDYLDGKHRLRVIVSMDDESRTHWNFLPESGGRGMTIRDMPQTQRSLTHRLTAQHPTAPLPGSDD